MTQRLGELHCQFNHSQSQTLAMLSANQYIFHEQTQKLPEFARALVHSQPRRRYFI